MAASEFSGLIPFAINFSIVFGSAVYFGRKPLQKFVYQRHERQKDLVESAAVAKKAAEQRFVKIQSSLRNLSDESRKIAEELEKEGKQEAEQILKRADLEVERLNKDAERLTVNEGEQQLNKIRRQIISDAIERAEKSIRSGMKKEDHSAIIRVAKTKIEAETVNG